MGRRRTQADRDAEMPRRGDTEMRRHRHARPQRHNDAEMQRHTDPGILASGHS
jgi:hypothetical protein